MEIRLCPVREIAEWFQVRRTKFVKQSPQLSCESAFESRVAASASQRRPPHASHRVSLIEPRHNLNAFVTSDPGACSI
jgi:hypothetical protein